MKVEVAVLPGLPGPNSPYGLCGRKAIFEKEAPYIPKGIIIHGWVGDSIQ